MHSTTRFAMNRRRSAGLAGASLRATAPAGKHRTGIARVIARHLLDLRLNGITAGAGLRTAVTAGVRESVSTGGDAAVFSGTVFAGACVTLPTIAWPPSPTDTCRTVTFCSPPVR